MMVCMTVLGPLAEALVVVWGVDMGPLPIIKLKNGSEFAPAKGMDGVVCSFGLDWYDSKYESEAIWPSDGVEGCREWYRCCWFKDLNCGGPLLKLEEERGGSIVSDLYVKW